MSLRQQHGNGGKGVSGGKRLVWRITAAAPLGEYVDPDAPEPPPQQQRAEPVEGGPPAEPGWLVSSFELAHGLEVSDQSDTIPGELFDELFKDKR
jgi:hypothetical protein